MFEEDYIRLVIKPRMDAILLGGVGSIKELGERFNEAYSCKVSKNRITEWLKALGYRVTRTVQIAGPVQPAPAPTPAPARRPEYDSIETPQRQPFNIPVQSMFSNVVMPGFEE
jgi:hypothetical protein